MTVLYQCVDVVMLPLEIFHFPLLGLSTVWDSLGLAFVVIFLLFHVLYTFMKMFLNSYFDDSSSYVGFCPWNIQRSR